MKSIQNRYNIIENSFLFLFIILPFMSVLSILFPIYNIMGSPLMGLLKEFVIGISILAMIYSFIKSRRIKFEKEYLFLLLFMIYGVFHISTRVNLIQAIDKFRLIYLYPIYFLSLLYFIRNEKYKFNIKSIKYKMENIFFIQIIIMIVFAVLQFIFKKGILKLLYQERYRNLQINLLGKKDLRLISLMLNPINFALFCNISIAFLLFNKNLNNKLKWILISILSIFILFTFSRIGYLILIVEIGIYLVFFNSNMKRNIVLFTLLAVVFITLFLLINYDIVNEKDYPVLQRFTQLDLEYIKNNSRITAWSNYLDETLNNDLNKRLLGLGLGTASSNANLVNNNPNIYLVESAYVSILGELGIIGLFLYLLIIIKYIYNSFIIKMHDSRNFYFLITFLLIILIAGITNNIHYNNPFSYYFYLAYFYTEVYMLKDYKEQL